MRIIISSSPTGGHLFPALMVAEQLRQMGHDLLFAGTFGFGTVWIRSAGFRFEEVSANPLVFSSIRKGFSSVISMVRASGAGRNILSRFRPDVVIGFGGYGSFPVVLAAYLSGRPCLIHEQNVTVGRANAVMSRFAKKVAVSFKQSFSCFPKAKTVLTGCPYHGIPVEAQRNKAFEMLGLKPGKVTVLVFGGSQGSSRINKEFFSAAGLLIKEIDLQVIHISGNNDYEGLREGYAKAGIPVGLFAFLDEIGYAYLAADIVVSRAGAVTVFEIAASRLPAVFIPYPHATAGHQEKNAIALSELGSAAIIREEELSAQALKDAILKMLIYRGNAIEMERRFKEFCIPDAARRIAEEALSLAKNG